MDNEYVIEFCYENLEETSVLDGGRKIHARCPFCGDSKKSKKKKRFHLTLKDDWVGHCFNCNWSGNFVALYAHIKGLKYNEAYKELYSFENQIESFRKGKVERVPEKKIHTESNFNSILDDCLVESSSPDSIIHKKLLETLKVFRSKRQVPEKYPLFIAYKGLFKNRIIIPIYKGENIVYFQARATTDLQEQKYLNPEADKATIILNEESLDRSKYIIITEGIIDAFSVDNATCALGASISDEFLEELYKKTDKNIIIALDNDERGIIETLNIIERSLFSNKLLYFVSPRKEKDLNEVKINSSVINNIYDFVVENSYTKFDIELKMKLEGLYQNIINSKKYEIQSAKLINEDDFTKKIKEKFGI